MQLEQIIFFLISLMLAAVFAPLIIKFLKKYNITRQSSRNVTTEVKNGKPIMGGLIFIIPTVLVSILANYILPQGRFVSNESSNFFQNLASFFGGGVIKIPITVFVISAILGGIDDVLNLFGTDRAILKLSRVLKLITVHKSTFERVKLAILLPWHAYKNFFFMLGSNPGKGVQAHEKILVELIIGAIVSWWIFGYIGIHTITLPIFGLIDLGILMVPFIIFTIILMSNAVNITDGVDGLSSGLTIISLVGFLIISIAKNNLPISILIVILLGSLLVYFYYNKKPAKVEMGDTGSLALGVMLSVIAFALGQPFLLIPFCIVFLAEFASSLIQGLGRRLLGKRIFKMAPLHHHFEMLGWSEWKIVLSFFSVAIIGVIGGLIWVI